MLIILLAFLYAISHWDNLSILLGVYSAQIQLIHKCERSEIFCLSSVTVPGQNFILIVR